MAASPRPAHAGATAQPTSHLQHTTTSPLLARSPLSSSMTMNAIATSPTIATKQAPGAPLANGPGSPEGPAQLAHLLSSAYRDADGLRKELAHTRKRLERAERVLSAVHAGAYSGETAPPDDGNSPAKVMPMPESALKAIFDAEQRAEAAEAERDGLLSKLKAMSDGWGDMERYMALMETRLLDARASYSKILAEGAGQFTAGPLPFLSQTLPPPRSGSGYPISVNVPVASSRPSSASVRFPPTHPSAPSTFFQGMNLPPPPNPGNRRARTDSLDANGYPGGGGSGLPPNKKHRGEREAYDSYPPAQLPTPVLQHRKPHSRADSYGEQRFEEYGARGRAHHTHSRAPTHSDNHHRREPRSRSSSRSSASSLSLDEMIIQATSQEQRSAAHADAPRRPVPVPHEHGLVGAPDVGYERALEAQRAAASAAGGYEARGGMEAYDSHGRPRSRSDAIPTGASESIGQRLAKFGPATGPGLPPATAAGSGAQTGLSAPPASGPLPQPGQVQTYQTHIFAPPVTGAPVKKSRSTFVNSGPGLPGPGTTGSVMTLGANGQVIAGPSGLGPGGFPATNTQGQRICRQCGMPGRYKDGKCVEKWGPGPEGPGTVCDRCRKKMKRVERRGTLDAMSQGRINSPSFVAYTGDAISRTGAQGAFNAGLQRSDTLPAMHNPYPPSPRGGGGGGGVGPHGTQLMEAYDRSPGRASASSSSESALSPPTPPRDVPLVAPSSAKGTPPLRSRRASPMRPPIAVLEREQSPTRMLEDALDEPVRRGVHDDGEDDADGDVDADADADGEGDAEMDLLEAVDAAEETRKSRAGSGVRMKEEDESV